LPEKYFDSAEKNCNDNLQNCYARLAPRNIVNKNPGFRALYLAGRNEFRFGDFNKYFFSFSAAGFCPKN